MTFPVEIVLKGRDSAVTESIHVPSADEPAWDDAMVHDMLVGILRAIGRVEDPDAAPDRPVILQGFSWIVEPMEDGVVIAIEIPMGAAVAGPFAVDQARLDAVVSRVIRADRQMRMPDTIH